MLRKTISIEIDSIKLDGILAIPANAKGIVIFAHGSGSSRLSPRNTYVANVLFEDELATLLFDLLTEEEDQTYENRFNIPLLAKRLEKVTDWIIKNPETEHLKIGYFGSSTGSAAALLAASKLGTKINAVVSRGGRPDLVIDMLGKVSAPTLLIVGGEDEPVIEMNQRAYESLKCKKEIEIIPGATHLFEEPGKLENVAELATDWFKQHM